MNSPLVESSQRCVPPEIGQSAAGRWRQCPDYTENETPRRRYRYLHCLLSIDTQRVTYYSDGEETDNKAQTEMD